MHSRAEQQQKLADAAIAADAAPASPCFPPVRFFARSPSIALTRLPNSGAERDSSFQHAPTRNSSFSALLAKMPPLCRAITSARPKLNSSVTARLKQRSIIPVCDPEPDLTKLFPGFTPEGVSG